MRPRAHYRKPKKAKNTALATIRIILTFATIALLAMVFYFAWKDGWESVFAWFGGKYFCLIVVVLFLAITAMCWIIEAIMKIRRLREDE